ncbi:hypothetical protein [Shewanella frigidimarina]|uniref:hypothetical protein n=1 Tax=Shewanella frigidimarina TaxID=56812 RepID=UPI003D7BE850
MKKLSALELFNTLSVSQKLSFDPNGKRGANEMRQEIARLQAIKDRLHQNTLSKTKPMRTQEQIERGVYDYVDSLQMEAFIENDNRTGGFRQALGLRPSSEKPKMLGDKWAYKIINNEIHDYHYYSKSWHKSYGPKITHERYVVFGRMYYGKPQTKTIEVRSFTGDWLVNAAIKAELLTPVKKPHASLAVRLKNVYDAKLIDVKRGFEIYSRTLLGEHVDYAIKSPMGVVYHSNERKTLIRGLMQKQKVALSGLIKTDTDFIDFNLCRKLGFCVTGIESFCNDFVLDAKKEYRLADIEKRVREMARVNVTAYLPELKTLAKHFDYKVDFSTR